MTVRPVSTYRVRDTEDELYLSVDVEALPHRPCPVCGADTMCGCWPHFMYDGRYLLTGQILDMQATGLIPFPTDNPDPWRQAMLSVQRFDPGPGLRGDA